MTVNTYLESIKDKAYQQDYTISKSLTTLQMRLKHHFPYELHSHFTFGSFTRNTMLPRSFDPKSDVDYMVVFNNVIYNPQAYLNKLKAFVTKYYHSSDIKQSHPTIQLSLNHITFELVPASHSQLYGYQIPSKDNILHNWMRTDPNAFNTELTSCNRNNQNMIKPLVRILKYWNANAGYVFESYELEKQIVNFQYYYCSNLKQYFYAAVEQLRTSYIMAAWKNDKINYLKSCIALAQTFEQQSNPIAAELAIKRILPHKI